ncbi:uncharacterized protein RSE6_12962 [Rhynchosporium secalis]|uniref:Yeast cell wall synthesis Kre9/Knh1-like N-terminal domain-containing protein n=1 Tax=Rhynchosporium secalis TaxID=38038 RepID=A0A1E1MRV1_RHYSE|nr:uncharacterized protein RSE6_12962 [Rhynchosporium secalis]
MFVSRWHLLLWQATIVYFALPIDAIVFSNGSASLVGIKAGTQYNISWMDAESPVNLTLMNGEGDDLKTVSTMISGLIGTAGSYVWNIPSDLPVDYYAIQLSDSKATPNYSVMFEVTGGPTLVDTPTQINSTSSSSPTSPPSSLASISIPPTSNNSSPSQTSTLPSNAKSTTPPESNQSGSRGGLSTGAKAGIGVSVSMFISISILLGFWWGRRSAIRNKGPTNEQSNDNVTHEPSNGDAMGKAELGAEEKQKAELEEGGPSNGQLLGVGGRAELDGEEKAELDGKEKEELDSRRRSAEPEGTEVIRPSNWWKNDRAELEGKRSAERHELG